MICNIFSSVEVFAVMKGKLERLTACLCVLVVVSVNTPVWAILNDEEYYPDPYAAGSVYQGEWQAAMPISQTGEVPGMQIDQWGGGSGASAGEWQAAMPVSQGGQVSVSPRVGIDPAAWKGLSSEKGQEMAGFLLDDFSAMEGFLSANDRKSGSSCYFGYERDGIGCSTTWYRAGGREVVTSLEISREGYTLFGMDVYTSLEDFKSTASGTGFEYVHYFEGSGVILYAKDGFELERMVIPGGKCRISCSAGRKNYISGPEDVTDVTDLAGYIGRSVLEVCRMFPELEFRTGQESQTARAETSFFTFTAKQEPDKTLAECPVSGIRLKSDSGPYTIYGIGSRMSTEEASLQAESLGFTYDGGNGEYFDADRNILNVIGAYTLQYHG